MALFLRPEGWEWNSFVKIIKWTNNCKIFDAVPVVCKKYSKSERNLTLTWALAIFLEVQSFGHSHCSPYWVWEWGPATCTLTSPPADSDAAKVWEPFQTCWQICNYVGYFKNWCHRNLIGLGTAWTSGCLKSVPSGCNAQPRQRATGLKKQKIHNCEVKRTQF